MKLISNWKDWWKLYSTYFLILLGALPTVWAELPDDVKTGLGSHTLSVVAGVLAVAGIISRVIIQTNALADKTTPK